MCLHAFFRALVDICCLPWCAPATHACSAQPLFKAEATLQLGLLHSLPPLWAAALVDICCDDQRHILYTRSQASVLQASGVK